MAYVKTTWLDRIVQYPRRYRDQNSNQLTLTPDEGTVTEAGTTVNAARLNNIETAIETIDSALPGIEASIQSVRIRSYYGL